MDFNIVRENWFPPRDANDVFSVRKRRTERYGTMFHSGRISVLDVNYELEIRKKIYTGLDPTKR